MLTKCICTNCAGHLEFEEENAGETIPCPHCGFKTVLTLPGIRPPDPERLAWLRKRILLWRLRWVAGAAAGVAGLGYVLYRWGVPWVQDLLPAVDSKLKALTLLILSCLVAPLALAWLVFPVVLFFQLRRLIQAVEPSNLRGGVEETESEALLSADSSSRDSATPREGPL